MNVVVVKGLILKAPLGGVCNASAVSFTLLLLNKGFVSPGSTVKDSIEPMMKAHLHRIESTAFYLSIW